MKKHKSMIIFIVCFLAYTSIYIARLNLSVASPVLMETTLTATQIGLLGSAFSIVFAIGRLINGMLTDKLPAWIMISIGLGIAGISNILIGLFPPFIGILLLWSANAYAQSMLWSAVLCIVSAIYDEKTAKRKTSYMVTSVAVGNILGIILNTFFINRFGLRFAFIIPGGITLLFCIMIMLTTKDVKTVKVQARPHIPLYELFKVRKIQIALIPALFHGMIKDNVSFWMVVFFTSRYAINLEQSAYFVWFIPVVGLIGRLLFPIFYHATHHKEQTVALFGFIACAAAVIPLCIPDTPPIIAMLMLGIIYAAVSVVNTAELSIFPIQFLETGNVASVSGVMDFATYLGAGIGSFLYGLIIDGAGFTPVLISWAVISLISACILKPLSQIKKVQ